MPMFGTKEHFAIQLDRRFKNLFHLRLWCNNKPIGNFYDSIIVSMVVDGMKQFIKNEKLRRIKNSHTLSKEVLSYVLFDSNYCDDSEIYHNKIKKIRNKKSIRERKWKKLLKSGTHSFLGLYHHLFSLDAITVYVFETKVIVLLNEPQCNRQRLIWRDSRSLSLYEGFIPPNFFVEKLMRECIAYIEKNNLILEDRWVMPSVYVEDV